MRWDSLRLRLALAAAVTLALALSLSGLLLAGLFARHVERRVDVELQNHLSQIAGALELTAEGELRLAPPPADPRFFAPASGLYWQVKLPDGTLKRSRSLWEHEIPLPDDSLADGSIHRHSVPGSGSSTLYAVERRLTVGPDSRPLAVRVSVAIDRREIDDATARFRAALLPSLAIMGGVLLAALLAMIHFGLSPFGALGRALVRVREGRAAAVEGAFPAEVQPLVHGMNALLEKERATLARARERAGDLAHGFKTPLAILAATARDLRRDGRTGAATEIEAQIEIMGRHVRRELAAARTAGAAAIGGTGVAVRPLLDKVIAALERVSADRRLTWNVTGDDAARFAGDGDDLLELVGNVCDNASKWAVSRIEIALETGSGRLKLTVDDDGDGIPAGSEAAVLERGRRLGEHAAGTGLGLAIVARIVEAYAGSIQLGRSRLGGLAVTIELPAAPAPRTGAGEI